MDKVSSWSLLSIAVCFFVTLYSLSTAEIHLNDNEKSAIRTTFDLFKTNLNANCITFFQTMFDDHPELYEKIPALKGAKTSEFPTNDIIANKKAPLFADYLQNLVAKMDNRDDVRELIRTMLNKKANKPELKEMKLENFANGYNALTKTLSKVLGSKITPSDLEAWRKLTTIALQIIGEELPKINRPVVHLTDSEVLTIRNTMDLVKTNLNDNMVVFFQILFDSHPEYHHSIDKLADVKTSDFPTNEFVRDKFGPDAFESIYGVVEKMANRDELLVTIKETLREWTDKSLRPGYYAHAVDAIVKMLSTQYGSKITQGDLAAWGNFKTLLVQVIEDYGKLTESEKMAIRSTTEMFKLNLKDNMVVFYQILFDDHPNYHQSVSSLKDVKTSEFPTNEFIRDKQGPKTGATIVELVANMDNREKLSSTIKDMIASRGTTMKLKVEDYSNAFDALLKTFSKQFGSKMTTGDTAGWKKFIYLILQLIEEAIKKN